MTTTSYRVAAGAVFGVVLLSAVPAWAQLVIEPQSIEVMVPQEETVTQTVTLTNAGAEPLTFCVSFERPLQRAEGETRLVEGAASGGTPCGEYGEVLHYFDEEDFGAGWGPVGVVMTPEGRLFTSEVSFLHRTFEFTHDLTLIRSFEHPTVAELVPFPATRGVGYDTESGTLWWMNFERQGGSQGGTRRVLLLEGDLDGVPTGRRIQVAPPDDPIDSFDPGGLAYDVATDRFYFLGILGDRQNPDNWRLWAVDRAGTVPEGYPVRPEPYSEGVFNIIDAHGGAEGGPEGVRVEYGAFPLGAPGNDRIAVVDRWGNSEGEALETPVPSVLLEAGGAGPNGNPLRSRTDPNGVMYMTFTNFDHTGIVGIRPHPLPPSWLVVDSDAGPEAAWDGTLAPDESRQVVLTFRAGAREVGTYTSALQAFDAATGEAVEVPLTLTVTRGTDAEDGAGVPEAVSLAAYPNPSAGAATVVLTLPTDAEVRLTVYDVLGRRVAVLAEGPREAGTHRFRFGGRSLPSGVYLLRAETPGEVLTRRITLLR